MKPKEISYARTYNQNYQSYRAAVTLELEDWETDLDACYAQAREIVRQQIGKQCSDYNGADSDEVLVLKEAIEKLDKERVQSYDDIRKLRSRIRESQVLSRQLTSSLESGFAIFSELLGMLDMAGISTERLADLSDFRDKLSEFLNPSKTDVNSNDGNDCDDEDEDDEDQYEDEMRM